MDTSPSQYFISSLATRFSAETNLLVTKVSPLFDERKLDYCGNALLGVATGQEVVKYVVFCVNSRYIQRFLEPAYLNSDLKCTYDDTLIACVLLVREESIPISSCLGLQVSLRRKKCSASTRWLPPSLFKTTYTGE